MKVIIAIELENPVTLHIQSENRENLEDCLGDIISDVTLVLEGKYKHNGNLEVLKRLIAKPTSC